MATYLMKKKSSPIWKYFAIIDNTFAQCRICKMAISYKTTVTNLKKHIERKHTVNSVIIKQENLEENNLQQQMNFNAGISQGILEPTKELSVNSKEQIDSALIQLFIKDLQPISIVDNEGFKLFVKELNPFYELPSTTTISTSLIPTMYDECIRNCKELALYINMLCLTLDFWTSRQEEKFVSITAHYIDEYFNRKSFFLKCLPIHPTKNISTELRKLAAEWNIEEKILMVVSDKTSDITNVIENDLGWTHFPCFAHSLNYIIEDALKIVQNVIMDVKTIVGYFNNNEEINVKFKSHQKNYETYNLVQSKPNKWNTIYYMLERITEHEDAVKTALDGIEHNLPNFQAEDWKLLHQLCKILKAFEHITKQISDGKYMALSLTIVFINGLNSVLKKLKFLKQCDTVKQIINTIQTGISNAFPNIEHVEIFATATFLDPRFKNIIFEDSIALYKIKKDITNI